jgi:hypothetical protein
VTSLKPWFAVATPHEDIRKGRLEESIFAANVWAVAQGTAPQVYLDPEEFFRKTYMTVGLATILKRVAGALTGADSGDRIISLQTGFGGGKTHTLVSLWHLAKHAKRLQKSADAKELKAALGDTFPQNVKGVAVFTNATCDATQGRHTPEGVHTRTLWGEIALQLGGKALYEKVRANDETQRVPQGLFVEVLKAASPCLILLDELADYCVGAAAVSVGDTSLADQTISFVQQLTEAVAQVPGAVVVATLPASKFEVAQSEKGQEAFVTLEKRFQRLGADIKPVADDEIYEVVRRRLFETIDSDYPTKVAEAYHAMYTSHSNEVPSEATKASYRDQIARAYPFHPLVIDALHTRWGSHPDLQRTRGVLRLLASLVGDLWKHRDAATQSQPLIQPCHIRWSIDALQATLTRLWGPAYQSVAAADVLGEKSNAALFDDERGDDYRRERIGQGLASAILLGSFGGQGQKSGFSAKDLKLACSRPGLNWNYTDGALLELESRCFYLHDAAAGNLGKRYWFGTKPTLNKLVVQYRQQVARETFDTDIIQALEAETRKSVLGGATWRLLANPESDLPEQKSLTLLLLPPSLSWGEDEAGRQAVRKRATELSTKCGTKNRHYRNTLLSLAPTPRGLSKLRSAYRERAALLGVQQDYGTQLDDEQRQDLRTRLSNAEKAAVDALGPAYTVAIKVNGGIEEVSLNDARPNFAEHLAYLWSSLVEDAEWILKRVGSVTLQKAGLVPTEGGILVKDAVDAFLRFTDKPILATKDAVTIGLAQACRDGLIGLARGPSVQNLQARYCRQDVSVDATEDGIWIIPPFEQEVPKPSTTTATDPKPGETPPDTKPTTGGMTGGGGGPAPRRLRKLTVRGSVPLDSYGEVFRCFVGPAARMDLKKFNIAIQLDLEAKTDKPLDPNDSTLKAMNEAARQLGLSFDVEE